MTPSPSPRFLVFMPFIFEWEGESYENDPSDPGGATKFGIDQRSHPNENIRTLTKERALEIYWGEWNADGCEAKGSPFAEVFFNCAVNMGLGRAREFDAEIEGEDWRGFLTKQETYYNRLADNHKNFEKFRRGWLNRTSALRKRFS